MTVHPLYRLVVRIVVALAFAAALTFLFVRAFVPSGRLTVVDDLVHPVPFVSLPQPTALTSAAETDDGRTLTPFIGSPIFFDLTPPSGFTTAAVTITYQNDGQPVAEIGALESSIDQQYLMKPIENRVIDALPWKQVSSGTLTLYERHDRYASVDEFFRTPPLRSSLAVYRADAPIPYVLPGYVPSATPREIDVSLRGQQRMLTYVKDEPLNFTFTVQDMNRSAGADPVTVSVYRGDDTKPIARTVLPDDGDVTTDQRSSPLRTIPITVTAPSEGFYKIEFTADDDIFIRKIVTTQQKLVFEDKLYLGDQVGFSDKTPPITVYTDGQHVTGYTPHAEAVQTLKVGDANMTLDQPNVTYEQAVAGKGLAPITSPKRDVLLGTTGLFALSPDEYFDPLPYEMQWFTTPQDLNDRGIDYVLSSYEPPARIDGLEQGTATFDLRKLARTPEGAFRFVVNLPGIATTRYPFKVASIGFAMQRPPVTLWNAVPALFESFRPQTQPVADIVIDGKTYDESPP
jgi:hypothetical protein